MKKRILILSLVVVFCFTFSANIWADDSIVNSASDVERQSSKLPFVDVSRDTWYYDDVAYLFEKNMVNGVSATQFVPNKSMTRAEFTAIFSNIQGVNLGGYTGETKFSDVKPNAWYSQCIQWATESELIYGRSDSLFEPNAAISREEACTILFRYAVKNGKPVIDIPEVKFADDSDIASWAKEAIYNLRQYGIIIGYNDKVYPKNAIIRAEGAKIFSAYLQGIGYGESSEPILEEGDSVVYEAEEVTDLDILYNMAKSEEYTASSMISNESVNLKKEATLRCIENSGINLSAQVEEKVSVYEVTQHLRTIKKADGLLEKQYVSMVIAELPVSMINNDAAEIIASAEIVNGGVYDSTYSVKAYAKISYNTSDYSNGAYWPNLKVTQVKGTWQIKDSSVTVTSKKVYLRYFGATHNGPAVTDQFGPYMVSGLTGTFTVSGAKTIAAFGEFSVKCSSVCTISRGSSTWYLTSSVGIG